MSSTLQETPTGLTSAQVQERIAEGKINTIPNSPVRSLREIIWANVFNPVNAIMLTLFVLILVAKSPKDALFVGVVFSNSIIGILTELRAKKELDRLEVLNAPKAQVVRDGNSYEIQVGEIVSDDVLEIKSGDQVVVDGEVIHSIGLELDESLLTGESDYISKSVGDEVLSGSFVTAGNGYQIATGIGAESYANKLSEEARRFTLVGSELKTGINWILKILMIIIPPTSTLLFLALLRNDESGWQQDLRSSIGAAVAMVPDGLVLLTSMAFLAGVITLARQKALAKELATVELLARVDVLCLDKTGTITTGAISFNDIELVSESEEELGEEFVSQALGAFSWATPNPNATMKAVAEKYSPPSNWTPNHIEPFSSERKWSAVEFVEQGLFYFGAPDILLAKDHPIHQRVLAHSNEGRRILLLCKSKSSFNTDTKNQLPQDISPIALILLEDEIRPDAHEIFAYFQKQGVALKVISGDTMNTVAVVATKAGIKGASENAINAQELPTDDPEALAEILENNVVFGRVTPHQKRAMVNALKSRGHTVAMTGDGVNDVLALKDSDMGIAMGSGSSATKSVAELVLLDNRFSTLPKVLTESRKVINNVERISNLFITKAVYAVLIAIGIGLASTEFPFLPRHLTLIGTFSIGLPGLILALAPSTQKVEKGFIRRALKFSIPAGIISAIATGIAYGLAKNDAAINLAEARTIATFTLLAIGLFILGVTARPFRLWKLGLIVFMAILYGLILLIPFTKNYFELELPSVTGIWIATSIIVAIGGLLIMTIPFIFKGLITEEDKS